MSRETYYRWVSHSASHEPAWAEGERHLAELSVRRIRSPRGALCDWVLIDEVLGLGDEPTDDPATELVAVRRQLSGGWPGPDEEYPTAFARCLARLVGSGAALAAGFTADE
jgi:hypothetical protein